MMMPRNLCIIKSQNDAYHFLLLTINPVTSFIDAIALTMQWHIYSQIKSLIFYKLSVQAVVQFS